MVAVVPARVSVKGQFMTLKSLGTWRRMSSVSTIIFNRLNLFVEDIMNL